MKIKQTLGSVTLMLVVAGLASVYASGARLANSQPSLEVLKMTDEQAVATATESFYAALNTMFTGNGQPIKDLWSRAKDVTYMGPNGLYLVGWEKIEQEWNRQAANKLGGRVTPQQIHIVVGTDIAVINCIESGENIINGKKETVQIRSSTVFRKENGEWKVIGHQTDPLGYMNNPK
jgi:ketosteroid isomerase-like protein